MHAMQEQIDACNAIMIFGVHGWSFKSFSLIKSWVQNWVSTIYMKSDLEIWISQFSTDIAFVELLSSFSIKPQ